MSHKRPPETKIDRIVTMNHAQLGHRDKGFTGRGGQGLSDQGMEQSMAVPSCSKTSDQNSSHLTKNSPKFGLRAASHGSEYLRIAFNLFLVTLNKLGSKDIKKRAIFQLKSMILKKT